MIRHLMNTGEVALALGVTRARVSQLAADRADFPKPVAYTTVGARSMMLWAPDAITRWNDTADRTPGRAPAIERA